MDPLVIPHAPHASSEAEAEAGAGGHLGMSASPLPSPSATVGDVVDHENARIYVGRPAAHSPLLVRLLYTYFFLPVWAVLAILCCNVLLQIFFVFAIPAAAAGLSNREHAVHAVSSLVLYALLPMPMVSILTSCASLVIDAWSPFEHPYLRRKVARLSSGRVWVDVSLLVGVMAALPGVIWGIFRLFMVHHEDAMVMRAIHGVILLCELGFAHGLGSLLWAKWRPQRAPWQPPMVARAKALHVVGGFVVAGYSMGVGMSVRAPVSVVSWGMIITTLASAVVLVFYVLVRTLVDFRTMGMRRSVYGWWFWVAGAVASVVVAVTLKTTYGLWGVLMAEGCLATTLVVVGTRKEKTRRERRYEVPESRHVVYRLLLMRGCLYVFFVAIGLLAILAVMQESQVVSPCPLLSDLPKLATLAANASYTPCGLGHDDACSGETRNGGWQLAGRGRYPICHAQLYGMDIVDLALLADMATLVGHGTCWKGSWDSIFSSLFDPADWEKRYESQPSDWVGFADIFNRKHNVSVVTVRGTVPHRLLDVLQDADLFAPVVSLQAISFVVPITTAWPDKAIAELAHAGHTIHRFFAGTEQRQRRYTDPLARYIAQINGTRPVLLLGHSLGGWVAKVVGAQHGHTAIAFSSPGLLWGRLSHNLTEQDINTYAVNVVPLRDVVPQVDRHGGLVQHLRCTGNAAVCHNMERTVCELHQGCGYRGRKLNCAPFMSPPLSQR